MWSPTSVLGNWPEQLCLANDDSVPFRGYLLQNPKSDALLQGLMLFGPSIWILIASPFKFQQLRCSKVVVLPNRRGYAKMVGISL